MGNARDPILVSSSEGYIHKRRHFYEDTGERRILMKMLCLLYNLHARTVGINQIKNVFMKQLDEDANNKFGMM